MTSSDRCHIVVPMPFSFALTLTAQLHGEMSQIYHHMPKAARILAKVVRIGYNIVSTSYQIQSILYQEVTFGTMKKLSFKTGDFIKEVKLILFLGIALYM